MKKLKERHEIEEKFKWKLEDIYADDDAFELDFEKTKKLCFDMERMQDKVADAVTLNNCLELYEDIYCLVDNLFSYSKMRMDEDNSNSKFQVLFGRARELAVKADAAAAFIEPMVLQFPEKIIKDPILKKYDIFLGEILRKKEHTLSAPEEKILAKSTEATGAAQEIFSMFNSYKTLNFFSCVFIDCYIFCLIALPISEFCILKKGIVSFVPGIPVICLIKNTGNLTENQSSNFRNILIDYG